MKNWVGNMGWFTLGFVVACSFCTALEAFASPPDFSLLRNKMPIVRPTTTPPPIPVPPPKPEIIEVKSPEIPTPTPSPSPGGE